MKNPFRNKSKKKPSENPEEGNSDTPLSGYAKYTNIIYLLIGSVAISFAAGYLLDNLLHFSFPVFKLIFSLAGIILGLYLVFKQLNSK
jgi:F0F1-type ATP synthase assembly protein I